MELWLSNFFPESLITTMEILCGNKLGPVELFGYITISYTSWPHSPTITPSRWSRNPSTAARMSLVHGPFSLFIGPNGCFARFLPVLVLWSISQLMKCFSLLFSLRNNNNIISYLLWNIILTFGNEIIDHTFECNLQ